MEVSVLFVEDEPQFVQCIASFLRRSGEEPADFASTGEDALKLFATRSYSIVFIDWLLPGPGPNGLELCRLFRARCDRIRLSFLTSKSSLDDRLTGFAAGADDYLVKPVEPLEILARIRATRRRLKASSAPPASSGLPTIPPTTRLAYDALVVDLATQLVSVAGGPPFELPKRQFLLLVHLLRSAGHFVPPRELLEQVFRGLPDPDGSTIRNHVGALRKSLGCAGPLIQSSRCAGYGIGVSVTEKWRSPLVDGPRVASVRENRASGGLGERQPLGPEVRKR